MSYIEKSDIIAWEDNNNKIYHPDCAPDYGEFKPITKNDLDKTESDGLIIICDECQKPIQEYGN